MIVGVGIVGGEDDEGEKSTGACWCLKMRSEGRVIEVRREVDKKDDDDDETR